MIDPRRDVSIFSYVGRPKVYGRRWDKSYPPVQGQTDSTGLQRNQQYGHKYQNNRTRNTPENFTSGLNFRVIRYADVLLLQAEALNELGQTTAAVPLVNQVRQRVGLAPSAPPTTAKPACACTCAPSVAAR